MNVDGQDLDRALEYRSAAAVAGLLPTGLFLIFLGLLIHALTIPGDEKVSSFILTGLCLVLGVGVVGLSLWRRRNPGKPVFTLAPDGIHYRIPMVKQILIPWHEIQGIDTIHVANDFWSSIWWLMLRYNPVVAYNVTVVLLPKRFYDEHIHVDSLLLRGPGWQANFIPKGEMVQMALHHDLVSVDPRALRAAVEARWLAFRDKPRAMSLSSVVAMGASARTFSRWQTVKVSVILIGIAIVLANLAGLWRAPGRPLDDEVRAKAREEQKYWQQTVRKNLEDSRRLEAERRELSKELEQDMRRVFGR